MADAAAGRPIDVHPDAGQRHRFERVERGYEVELIEHGPELLVFGGVAERAEHHGSRPQLDEEVERLPHLEQVLFAEHGADVEAVAAQSVLDFGHHPDIPRVFEVAAQAEADDLAVAFQ